MSRNQILRVIGAGLLMAGLLIFLDATSNQYILNDTTFLGNERLGPILYQKYADRFNQQQMLGGVLAVLGTALTLIPSETVSQKGNTNHDSASS